MKEGSLAQSLDNFQHLDNSYSCQERKLERCGQGAGRAPSRECCVTEAHGKFCFQRKGTVNSVIAKTGRAFDNTGQNSFSREEQKSDCEALRN